MKVLKILLFTLLGALVSCSNTNYLEGIPTQYRPDGPTTQKGQDLLKSKCSGEPPTAYVSYHVSTGGVTTSDIKTHAYNFHLEGGKIYCRYYGNSGFKSTTEEECAKAKSTIVLGASVRRHYTDLSKGSVYVEGKGCKFWAFAKQRTGVTL